MYNKSTEKVTKYYHFQCIYTIIGKQLWQCVRDNGMYRDCEVTWEVNKTEAS